ncbi:MAG: 23S rRNA (adenine(1618)-N(6))-methyltransferase RlmF [Lentimicrobium sp.]|nr:23S rRNA (adenine(1618)-N(6))-methyltransferase RlmF [Lentimicrobium sp.]
MQEKKKVHPLVKSRLHPNNRHRERYDFRQLTGTLPELIPFISKNIYNDESIDFADPEAVKMLNKALLKHYYDLGYWDIPAGYLCPPIPGRADYIHHIADLLRSKNFGKTPASTNFVCFDIGVGANCVYPVIGVKEYGWSFIGSDIDAVAIESARKIIEMNPVLAGKVEVRLQPDPKETFYRIIQKGELIDLSICNPPFHSSMEEAKSGTQRKLKNLKLNATANPILNFGGQSTELFCEGGEGHFIREMIRQSRQFAETCLWFSTLVSKQSNLKSAQAALEKIGASEVKTIPMGQGNKSSRIIAWTFQTPEQQKQWMNLRWKE